MGLTAKDVVGLSLHTQGGCKNFSRVIKSGVVYPCIRREFTYMYLTVFIEFVKFKNFDHA